MRPVESKYVKTISTPFHHRTTVAVVVPGPLEAALVDTRHGLLPHSRRDERLDWRSRILRRHLLRGHGESGINCLYVLKRRGFGCT